MLFCNTSTNTFLFVTLSIATIYACPEIEPIKCGPKDMICKGGVDHEGCPISDLCMPTKGPMGLDGFTECPGICPTTCGLEDMVCPGAMEIVLNFEPKSLA